MFRHARSASLLSIVLALPALGQGDPAVIAKIVKEGKENNQVWNHLEYLSHEIGTRLTGSTRLEIANKWTMSKFEEWGLTNCHLQQWGEIPIRFDRGPSHFKVLRPFAEEIAFTTRSWTAGTNGPVRGQVIRQPQTRQQLEAVRDKLAGAWILTPPRTRGGVVPVGEEPIVGDELAAVLKEAGIAGYITVSRNDLVITSGSWRNLEWDNLPTEVSVMITRTDYDRFNSRLADGEEVEVEINADNKFVQGPFPLYNTIAEIRGTEKPDEVVIVSAHLDTWDGPGSMGTQDNGTGSSVTLEAARILMAAGAQPKRTIRFILWTGEEQGLLGSRAYVNSLSDEEKARISACLVDDGGTNYQGGLVCIEPMAEMLRQAVAPVNAAFPDMPVRIRVVERMPRGGGSDHASFNAVGIPGFFWDEIGSGGREGKNYQFIHHTQHDTPRYAVPEYLVQSSVSTAITAYNLACADTLLPRQPADVAAAPGEERPRGGAGGRGPFEPVDGPVSGTWKAQFTSPAGAATALTMAIEMAADGRVRGSVTSEIGTNPIERGFFNAETGDLRFTITFNGSPVTFNGKVDGRNMKGTMGLEGVFSSEFTATKE